LNTHVGKHTSITPLQKQQPILNMHRTYTSYLSSNHLFVLLLLLLLLSLLA
jgi:hypothetical protein